MRLVRTLDGSLTLQSARFGETYRSRLGALQESWHVFVSGSGVATRLAAGRATTVLEVGLGAAHNLGATAAVALAFGTPLTYVALEREVLPAEAWASLGTGALGDPAFASALLHARAGWETTPGSVHRLRVGAVAFELRVGDARALPLPEGVDAVYLDGFSARVNPELWGEALLARLAATLAEGGTLVSYSVRGAVRRVLAAHGLVVERRPGPPGAKREMLWALRPRRRPGPGAAPALAGRRLAVVGAGVAGCSLALIAARAGAAVTLLDAGTGEGGASSLPAALLNPFRGRSGRASPEDLAGAAATWRWAAELFDAGLDPGAHPSGVVRVAASARQAHAWSRREGVVPFGPDPGAAPGRWRAPNGGILVPAAGWLDPWRWRRALRAAATALGATFRPGVRVQRLTCAERGGWRLLGDAIAGEDGGPFDFVALCLGAEPPGELPHLPVTPQPGTVALIASRRGGRPLAGAVSAAPLASPGAYGLDPRRRYWSVAGGRAREAGAPEWGGDRRGEAWSSLTGEEPDAPAALWRGVRARGPDPHPVVAELDRGLWWFGSFAGRGFLRAALEAERLRARWRRDA